MKYSKFTTEQLIDRWEDQRDVKNLMGIYVNHVIMNMDNDIYANLWSAREDVCYGENDGWYVGADAVKGYYQARYDRNVLVAALLQKKFAREIGDRTPEQNYGIGTFRDFPVTSAVVEVAADRETAKGLWYCWGSHAEVTPGGPVASWTWGYYAADFVREGDAWKIWHLQYTNDVDARCGTDWGLPAEKLPVLPEFAELDEFKMPAYTVAEPVRPAYSASRPLTGAPAIPVPYNTFAETFSYGI